MEKNILTKRLPVKTALSLKDYKKLKDGLKKKLTSRSSLYTFGKTCFVLGLPILAANTGQAQCQTFSMTNSAIPDAGGFANGLGVDMDGDGNDDLIFYEAPNGNGKVRRVTGGTMSIVTTGGAYPFRSAINFDNVDPIPNGNGADYRAYWDYPGGGNWPVEEGSGASTGFIGIKKGADYGFLEFTVIRSGGDYFASFPSGGAPLAGSGDAIAGDCTSLPVEFMSFMTETRGKDVTLIWKTTSEINNAGFEIQRSENGHDFKTIHWEEGQGNAQIINTYKHIDEELEPGKIYYYRLNQIDFDGSFDLSPVVSVQIEGLSTRVGEFSPNPVTDLAYIDISINKSSEWFSNVYDSKGTSVLVKSHELSTGLNRVSINMRDLNAGTYFVKLDNGSERFYKTLIVQ